MMISFAILLLLLLLLLWLLFLIWIVLNDQASPLESPQVIMFDFTTKQVEVLRKGINLHVSLFLYVLMLEH